MMGGDDEIKSSIGPGLRSCEGRETLRFVCLESVLRQGMSIFLIVQPGRTKWCCVAVSSSSSHLCDG